MKAILAQLVQGNTLTAAQAEDAFERMMTGQAEPAQVGALLGLMAGREATVEELVGAATVMRRHVLRIPAPEEVIDTCGTGGVGSRIFNVSTTAAIVAAACGAKVAKHGNRSVTSRSGSSEVLKFLGVNIEAGLEIQARCLAEAGICFAFAPQHHPAMKHVGPIRQALGFSTIFNLAGPLTNPAGARRQLVGVGSPQRAETLLAVLVRLGAMRAMVVCDQSAAGGARTCEVSVCGPTLVAQFDGTAMRTFTLLPEEAGVGRHGMEELEIGSVEESAGKVRAVLGGQKGAARDVVVVNAAAALWVAGKVETLRDGALLAAGALDSGAAYKTLEHLARVSQGT